MRAHFFLTLKNIKFRKKWVTCVPLILKIAIFGSHILHTFLRNLRISKNKSYTIHSFIGTLFSLYNITYVIYKFPSLFSLRINRKLRQFHNWVSFLLVLKSFRFRKFAVSLEDKIQFQESINLNTFSN